MTAARHNSSAAKPWGDKADRTLIQLVQKGESVSRIAIIMHRTGGSIDARINRLMEKGLLDTRPPQKPEKGEPYERIEEIKPSVTERAERRMLDTVCAMGGFPVARAEPVPGTNRTIPVWFALDGKPHPIWLAKYAQPQMLGTA